MLTRLASPAALGSVHVPCPSVPRPHPPTSHAAGPDQHSVAWSHCARGLRAHRQSQGAWEEDPKSVRFVGDNRKRRLAGVWAGLTPNGYIKKRSICVRNGKCKRKGLNKIALPTFPGKLQVWPAKETGRVWMPTGPDLQDVPSPSTDHSCSPGATSGPAGAGPVVVRNPEVGLKTRQGAAQRAPGPEHRNTQGPPHSDLRTHRGPPVP